MQEFLDKLRRGLLVALPPHESRALLFLAIVSIWAAVTLISAAQGQVFAAYRGRPQEWWSTLGYTAAIFSVWALLAPLLSMGVGRLLSSDLRSVARVTGLAFGYLIATALHVSIFVILFWPIYGDVSQSPLAMIPPVLFANLDKSAFAYIALVVAVHLRWRWRAQATAQAQARAQPERDGLWIRVGAKSLLVRFHEIDWIAAAGDYAEVHAGGRALLTDRSISSLSDQLPVEFARIHRSTIVRLDRISEVRSRGRGDADVVLRNGQTLRLSRRYRGNLAKFLSR